MCVVVLPIGLSCLVMFDFDHSRDRDTRWAFCYSRGCGCGDVEMADFRVFLKGIHSATCVTRIVTKPALSSQVAPR